MIKDLHMYKEIHETSDAIRHAKEVNMEVLTTIAKEVKKRNITNIVVVARGSSDNACQYFKYICEIYAGIPVTFAMPSVITKYNANVKYSNTLMIGVSQSGTGVDVAAVLDAARKNGVMTVGLTNFTDSLIATTCEYHIHMATSKEVSVAATKTFTLEMYLLGLLVACITNDKYLHEQLDKVPSLIDTVLNDEESIFEKARTCVDMNHCYVLGRGINYTSTVEVGLKLQETCYIKSKQFASSVFYHGPVAVIDETQNVILLHGEGVMNQDAYDMFNKMKENNANVYVVTNDDNFDIYDQVMKVPHCDEVISPFVIVPTMQLFVCALAVAKGNNPDTPRGLNKVTITK